MNRNRDCACGGGKGKKAETRPASSPDAIKALLDELVCSLPLEECRTCDCFQGFLTQLEIDSEADLSEILDPLQIAPCDMHACLGCDPCPPGTAFAEYLRNRRGAD